jgi:hypothetical protein
LSVSKSINQQDSTLVWRTQWIDANLITPESFKNARQDFSTLFFSSLLSQIIRLNSADKYQVSNCQQLSFLFCISFSNFAATFEDTKSGDCKRSCRIVLDKAYLLISYCTWVREKKTSLFWTELNCHKSVARGLLKTPSKSN